jgi:hypothetical protein
VAQALLLALSFEGPVLGRSRIKLLARFALASTVHVGRSSTNITEQKQKSLARIARLIATPFLAKSVSFDQPGQVA